MAAWLGIPDLSCHLDRLVVNEKEDTPVRRFPRGHYIAAKVLLILSRPVGGMLAVLQLQASGCRDRDDAYVALALAGRKPTGGPVIRAACLVAARAVAFQAPTSTTTRAVFALGHSFYADGSLNILPTLVRGTLVSLEQARCRGLPRRVGLWAVVVEVAGHLVSILFDVQAAPGCLTRTIAAQQVSDTSNPRPRTAHSVCRRDALAGSRPKMLTETRWRERLTAVRSFLPQLTPTSADY